MARTNIDVEEFLNEGLDNDFIPMKDEVLYYEYPDKQSNREIIEGCPSGIQIAQETDDDGWPWPEAQKELCVLTR